MLGMLQRLHKLSVKEDLQSLSERQHHGIQFPRLDSHQKKIGHGILKQHSFNLSDENIHDIFKKAEMRAKEMASKLGMVDALQKNKMWDTPPIATNLLQWHEDNVDEEEEEEEELSVESDDEAYDPSSLTELVEDIAELHAKKISNGESKSKETPNDTEKRNAIYNRGAYICKFR